MKNKLIKFIPALSVGMLFASLSPCIVSCFDNKNNKKSIVLQENKVKNFFEFLQNKAKNEPISNFNNEFGNFDEEKIQKFQEFLKALFDYKKTDIQSIHANQTDVTITPQDNVVFDLKGDVQKYCHLNDKHELVFSNINFETDKDVTYQCDSKFEFNKEESKQLKISAKFDNHKLLGFSNKNLDFKWFYEDLNNELVPLLPSSEIVIKNSEQDSLITIDSKFLEKNFIIGKKHFICKINNSYIHLVKNDGCQIEIKENLDKVDIKKVVALLNNETNKSEYFDWKSTETTRTIDFNEKGLNKLSELLGFSNTNSIEKLINPIQNASLIVNENQTTEHTLLKLNIQLSNYFEFTNSVEQKISNQNEPKMQAKIGVYDRSQNFDIEDIALNIFNQKEIDHNTKKHININVEHVKNFFEFLQNKAKNEPISNFNNEFGNFDEEKIQKFQEFLKALFDYKKTDIQSIHANQTDVTITPQDNVVFDLKGDVQKYCHLNDKHELVFSNINFETDKDVTYQCETKFLFNDVLPKKLSINAQFNNIKMNYSNSIIPEFKWFYKTIDGTLEPLEPSQDIQINSSFDKSNISISSNYFLNNKMLGNLHFICKVDDSFIHFKNNNGCDIQLVWDIPSFDAQKVVYFLNNLTNKSEYLNWQNAEKIVSFNNSGLMKFCEFLGFSNKWINEWHISPIESANFNILDNQDTSHIITDFNVQLNSDFLINNIFEQELNNKNEKNVKAKIGSLIFASRFTINNVAINIFHSKDIINDKYNYGLTPINKEIIYSEFKNLSYQVNISNTNLTKDMVESDVDYYLQNTTTGGTIKLKRNEYEIKFIDENTSSHSIVYNLNIFGSKIDVVPGEYHLMLKSNYGTFSLNDTSTDNNKLAIIHKIKVSVTNDDFSSIFYDVADHSVSNNWYDYQTNSYTESGKAHIFRKLFNFSDNLNLGDWWITHLLVSHWDDNLETCYPAGVMCWLCVKKMNIILNDRYIKLVAQPNGFVQYEVYHPRIALFSCYGTLCEPTNSFYFENFVVKYSLA